MFHSLKELKNYPKITDGSIKRTRTKSPFIQTWQNRHYKFDVSIKNGPIADPDVTLDGIEDTILLHYVMEIEYHRPRIRYEMKKVYGRPLIFPESQTTQYVNVIKSIITESGKSVSEVVEDIRAYVGYPCKFFRSNGAPVEFQRILDAYRAIQNKASIVSIEDILYEV